MWYTVHTHACIIRIHLRGKTCSFELSTFFRVPRANTPIFWVKPYPLRNEMKCSGKTEILYELVHDTTRKSENHELILPQCRNLKHFIVKLVHFNTCLHCHNLVVFRYFYENVSSERCGNPVETCLRLPLYGCHMNLVDNIILIFGYQKLG